MYTIKETKDYANCYIVCRFDCCVIIDPSQNYDEIMNHIGERKIVGLLVTHAHCDHVDIIGDFNCPIYIHEFDASLLFEDNYNGYYPKKHPYKRKELDIKLIKDGDKIPLADHFIETIHTPGHTKGSVSYLYQNKLFVGDLIFKEDIGRYDLYSGNLSDLKKSIKKIIDLDKMIKIFPGHGENTTIKNEYNNNNYVKKWFNK